MRRHLPLFTFFLSLRLLSLAQAGSLDISFSGNGKVQTLVGTSSNAAAVAIQPADQKIVVAGGYFNSPGNSGILVVRYNINGTLDNGFGSSGESLINFGSAQVVASCVAIQPNGMIVIAGGYAAPGGSWNLFVTRLTTMGVIDGSFNNIGFNTAPSYANIGASGVALQPDGKIVVTGEYYEPGSGDGKRGQFDFGVVRFTGTGQLDNSFGSGGQVITNPGSKKNIPTAIAVTSAGKIVVCGYREPWFADLGGVDSVLVMQYTKDGVLDVSNFGAGGIARYSVGSDDACTADAMTLQPDGRILLAGYYMSGGTEPDFLIMRLNTNGTLDNSFAGNGRLGVGFGHADYASGIGVEPATGQIVVSGITEPSGGNEFAICRVSTTGVLDNSFGSGGKVMIPWTSNTPVGSADGLAIQANGRIVVSGMAQTADLNGRMATLRLLSSGSNLTAVSDSIAVTRTASAFSTDSHPGIHLYPNPAASQLQVTGLPANEPVSLTVTDMGGNVVLQQRTGQGNVLLDISRLTPATYVLTITTAAGQRQSLPFIKGS